MDSLSRHDLLLVVIAAPLLAAGAVGLASPLGVPTALGLGSVPATGGVGYALFLDPPAPAA